MRMHMHTSGIWLHLRLLRGGGRSALLDVALPFIAGAVITLVLLLLLGLQHGLDQRADRTAWRIPEDASDTDTPTALQGGYIDYVGERPLTVIELAAITPQPPAVPEMHRFPAPGDLWVSPALADLLAELPANQLAARFPAPASDELPAALLESPNELLAVIGRDASDPVMHSERPEHQFNDIASLTPVEIDGWSTDPDLYHATYGDIALLVIVFTALPLVSLGDLASRLMAGRRQRRIATLRLLGASTAQVVRLTIAELAVVAGLGALTGALVHRVLLPLASDVPVKGGTWFAADIAPDTWLTLGTIAGVVAVLTLGALSGLIPAVRDPLRTYRSARQDTVRLRWWNLLFILAAITLFWIRSSNPFVSVTFTVIVFLGWGLVSTGPWLINAIGRVMSRAAGEPATFLAGRRLVANSRAAWRTVGGLVLAAFIAGFVASSLPAGLGNASTYASRTDRLDIVLPADDFSRAVDTATTVLHADGITADITTSAPPVWLEDDAWGTLSLRTNGPDADLDRARTALNANGIHGVELQRSDDLPSLWLLQDGIVIGLLVLPIAVLVALTAMIIGAIARMFEQRESLLALSLAGTPLSVLRSAQRREMLIPTLALGSLASLCGLISGASLGSLRAPHPISLLVFVTLFGVGALALRLAERSTQPILARVSTDLSERE